MEEEAEDDALGYLTLLPPAPLWLFDLLVGVTPLLQVGLSKPGWKEYADAYLNFTVTIKLFGKEMLFLGIPTSSGSTKDETR